MSAAAQCHKYTIRKTNLAGEANQSEALSWSKSASSRLENRTPLTVQKENSNKMHSDRVAAVPQSEQDENMIEMAGDDVDVPEELLKMVDEDATEEEGKDSILGQFQNLQNMDADQLKEKASATITELKSKAEEKCSVM